MLQRIEIYDMDGVLVDTSHRYRNLPDGTIDLDYWFRMATHDNIMQDKLLPMAEQYQESLRNPAVFVAIATARACGIADRAYIKRVLGWPQRLLCRAHGDMSPDWQLKTSLISTMLQGRKFRGLPAFFWDDNPRNVATIAKLGVWAYHVPSNITGKS